MILVVDKNLPEGVQSQLNNLQSGIDSLPTYEAKVAAAKAQFASQRSTAAFRQVCSVLRAMCSGACRCCYCEDSCADEVEHIKPKSFYPEEVFVWNNYLYACGPCNSPKADKFAVFCSSTGAQVDLVRKPADPIVPPTLGEPVLINPRTENPLKYLFLDLLGTFLFLPIATEGTKDYERATYTIATLRLNARDILLEAREEAYHSYRARLSEYITEKLNGVPQQKLDLRIQALKRMGHPTVWKEMQRQHKSIPELMTLFGQASEALNW